MSSRACLLSAVAFVLAAATPAAAEDWTGGYLGLSAGAAIQNGDWSTNEAFDPDGFAIPFSSGPNASFDDTSPAFGAFIGYDWQVSEQVVIGIEGDVTYSEQFSRVDRIPGIGLEGGGSDGRESSTTVETDLGGSVRGRLGFLALPDLMIFGTGGVSFLSMSSTSTCPADTEVCNPGFGARSKETERTLVGWTVGGGLEWRLDPMWTARAEYRYSDYGSSDVTTLDPTPGESFGSKGEVDLSTHSILLGVGIRF